MAMTTTAASTPIDMVADLERLALRFAAIAVAAAILIGIADTPAYPLAIGVEIIIILYLLLNNVAGATGTLSTIGSFIGGNKR